MARIRSIKPEFWTDEKVVTLSPFARLAFIGLWNFVDDYGRAPYSPARMKMQILPADSVDFPALLAEISGIGLITIYAVDDKQFLQVNGFHKHQKIDLRTKSKHPSPPPPTPNPPKFFPNLPLDQGREGIKEGNQDAAGAALFDEPEKPSEQTPEVELYRRGKELLGPSAGGLIKNLVKAKGGSIPLARAALETASTKQDRREYIGRIVKGNGDGPEDLRARGEAW